MTRACVSKMMVLDLFAGIGGFSLGLERTGGFETVAFCEIEKYPQRVLNKHWPEVPIYDDVRELTAARLASDGIARIDVITGGFPCQDISVAGKQAGIREGTRSGLWSECARLVSEIRPKYAIFENVSNLLSGPSERSGGWFSRILCDLASLGYDAEWHCIPASYVGAPHRRDRVWIVADSRYEGFYQRREHEKISNEITMQRSILWHGVQGWSEGKVLESQRSRCGGDAKIERFSWPAEPSVARVANGISSRAHRIKCLGNAVVPQIPEMIGRAILKKEAAMQSAK